MYKYVATGRLLDAAGTTATTASTAWLVKLGGLGAAYIAANQGIMEFSGWKEQSEKDSNGKRMRYMLGDTVAHAGVVVPSQDSCGAIYNLTEDSAKGMTDAKASLLVRKFPVVNKPNPREWAWFMSRRSAAQLQTSRTPTTAQETSAPRDTTGGNIIAADIYPTSCLGIPVYVTDAIRDDLAIGTI
jgi:hypothetical protein